MKLRPIGDHLIVKPLAAEAATASGIIIPDTADKERPERGEVLAVGPGRTLENGARTNMEDVQPGNTVVFKKYAPDEVKEGDDTYLVIRLDDVMAIID